VSHALRAPQLCLLAMALVTAACGTPASPPLPWSEARVTAFATWPVVDASTLAATARASGRPVVASLWARWCEPCLAEMPVLAALARQTGATWVSVATDAPDDAPERTLAALTTADRGADLFHARAPSGGPEAFLAPAGVAWTGMLPTHALFAGDGAFVGVLEGTLEADAADDLARRLTPGRVP
jgi:thiol-disulfide isomerase/thioredoxin